MIDGRFEGMKNLLSKWVRSSIHIGYSWKQIQTQLELFYQKHLSLSSKIINSDELSYMINNNNSDAFFNSNNNKDFNNNDNNKDFNNVEKQSYESSLENKSSDNSSQSLTLSQPNPESSNSSEEKQDNLKVKKQEILLEKQPKNISTFNTNSKSNDFLEMKKVEPNPSFQDSPFTASQRLLIGETISPAENAAIHLKARLSKAEQQKLVITLRKFKETKDISFLEKALEELQTDDCRNVIIKIMNQNLREKLRN